MEDDFLMMKRIVNLMKKTLSSNIVENVEINCSNNE